MLSTARKKALCGWLKKNQPLEFNSKIKLQKFLFFYEALSKAEGDHYDFNSLKGYINGPVFSDVYGDLTHRYTDFIRLIEESYELSDQTVDEGRAKAIGFLVKILTEKELSDLSHEFNIWKSQEGAIRNGVLHLRLDERDFTQEDVELITRLRNMYTEEYIDSVDVFWVINKCFIISQEEYNFLTEEHKEALISIALEEDLLNPVYLTLEDGVLLVD